MTRKFVLFKSEEKETKQIKLRESAENFFVKDVVQDLVGHPASWIILLGLEKTGT